MRDDDLNVKADALRAKYKTEEDEAAADDETIEEWRAAVSALSKDANAKRTNRGPWGDWLTTDPMPEPTTFKQLVDDLHEIHPNIRDAGAYKRVQELYGPARIAYHRKNKLDINTSKPK